MDFPVIIFLMMLRLNAVLSSSSMEWALKNYLYRCTGVGFSCDISGKDGSVSLCENRDSNEIKM